MKVLITGAGGFIGGELTKRFSNNGWKVYAFYRNTLPSLTPLISKNVHLVKLDLAQFKCQDLRLEQVDIIIHAAAQTHLIHNSSIQDYISGNLHTAINLCHLLENLKYSLIVYFSSLSIYGNITDNTLTEETPFQKPNYYGTTKYLAELIFYEKCTSSGLVCLRLPGVVAPGYLVPWIGRTLAKILNQETVTVYNPDALFNNIVDIDELFKLILHLAGSNWQGQKTVNMGTSNPITIQSIIDFFCNQSGSKSRIEYRDSRQKSFIIDTRCLRTDLGFEPAPTANIVQRFCKGTIGNRIL
jgi:nucleoside-diphosphate-sugar epimerase